MFVRKRKNKSGTTSVHLVEKRGGVYYFVKSVGSSADPRELERLEQKARDMLHPAVDTQLQLFHTPAPHDAAVLNFVGTLKNSSIKTIGPELIFGSVFDQIGFNAIPIKLFRHLVIARLAYPVSKLKTVDYLQRYEGTETTVDAIYKALDRFGKKYKALAECIAFEHTKKSLGTLTVVFYDMTTLYFEAEDEDDLRKVGFSKDGKFQHPQIMLGLLVGKGGLPIGYDIFEGNTFEGHTLMPTLEKIQKKYGFGKPTVVADAGLLSKKNLENLGDAGYRFIIGARIKNETDEVKAEILKRAKGMKDNESFVLKKKDGTRLVVTYTDKRARKDRHNREKGIRKLRARVKYGKLTKEHINNRGYNKFLTLDGYVAVAVDEEKIEADKLWDGLKGYITNTRLPPATVVENYGNLWQIERAFRISKTDLRIRPIHHYRRRRIEAHLTIAFVAYAIWKEIECQLLKAGLAISPKRAGELTHTMYAVDYTLPQSKEKKRTILAMDDEQTLLCGVIHKS